MNKRLGVFFSLLCAAALAAAQAPAQRTVREQLAGEAFALVQMDKLWDQMLGQMSASLAPVFDNMVQQAQVPKENQPKAVEILKQQFMAEFASPTVRAQFTGAGISEMARAFDEAELRDLIAFYQSSTGKKLIERQPAMVNNLMQAGRAVGEQAGRRAAERAMEQIQRDGLMRRGN